MDTNSVVGALRAYPRWTAALIICLALAGAVQALLDRRMGALEVASCVLGYIAVALATKLMLVRVVTWRRAHQFTAGSWKHVGAIFFVMAAGAVVALPYLQAVLPHVELSEIPAKADWLDGGLVEVEGVVLMSDQSRSVVPSLDVNGHPCVALVVTEDEFHALEKFHLKHSFVAGKFEKTRCAAPRVCNSSCGPYAIVHPSINLADRPSDQ